MRVRQAVLLLLLQLLLVLVVRAARLGVPHSGGVAARRAPWLGESLEPPVGACVGLAPGVGWLPGVGASLGCGAVVLGVAVVGPE